MMQHMLPLNDNIPPYLVSRLGRRGELLPTVGFVIRERCVAGLGLTTRARGGLTTRPPSRGGGLTTRPL